MNPDPNAKMSLAQFGSSVKKKYPAYASRPDEEIGQAMLKKYPQYAPRVESHLETSERERHARQTPMARMFERGSEALVNQAPAIMSTVGGVAGSLLGPWGSAGGAGIGGAAGEAMKERAQEGAVTHPMRVAGQGALGAASEAGGQLIGEFAPAVGAKLSEVSNNMMTNLIGATRRGALGQKASFKMATDIGKTVNDAINGGVSLKQIAGQIGNAKEELIQATEKLLQQVPEDSTIGVQSLLSKNANKAVEGTLNEGAQRNTLKLLSDFESQFPGEIGAQDAIKFRRSLLTETNPQGERIWPAGTKSFRTALYHDLNGELEKSMGKEAGAEFRANNQKVSRLIKAENTLDKKRLYGLGHPSSSKSAFQAVTHTITGGTPVRMGVLKSLKNAGKVANAVGEPARVGVPLAARGVAGALRPAGQGQNQQNQPQTPSNPTQSPSTLSSMKSAPLFMADPHPRGLVKPGNININDRPIVPNGKDSSTVWSTSFGTDDGEVLVPRVSDGEDGKAPHLMSEHEALQYYRKYGKFLGIFKTPDDANAYGNALHEQQARLKNVNGRTSAQ